ncbi:hypothetical protein [Sneathiella litorea]|uniref:Uncharacterized protein n=1 Tax=Sneathiella litorea TaxID=2606216 RepID=A0A6L8W556_9PROT|nr:hypothetical protein [Sneathiella litorea]MZR29510.1 hypothetical protein [Sneathiella litorea]
MSIQLETKAISIAVFCTAILLIFSHFILILSTYTFGYNTEPVFDAINLDSEQNISTFFSSVILLLSTILLYIISYSSYQEKSKSSKYWLVLAFIFSFLTVDESTKIHEQVVKIYWYFFGQGLDNRLDNYVWIAVYGVIFLAISFLYWRFVTSLPRKICILIFLSAGLYVFGAAGMEFFGALYVDQSWFRGDIASFNTDYAVYDAKYFTISGIEESLEMLGIATFIYALLSYIDIRWQGLYISLGGTPSVGGS